MQDAVKDGIGECRLVEILVPMLDGQLAGDDGRARVDPVVEHLEQIGAFRRGRRRQAPVDDNSTSVFASATRRRVKLPSP